jgi:hypothetical protein
MSILKVNAIRQTTATSDAVTLATDGTCTVKATNNLSNRNLIINGAMQVAQRGTSSTADGYKTVDRFKHEYGGENEAPTFAQHALTSSDTGPWAKGFRKSFHVTNGNQTGGAGAADYLTISYRPESQDIANSGWDYTNTSSYITLSFWVKSSVAQEFHGFLLTADGTRQLYSFSTGSLSANTWTKVTKTIPGNSNLEFDNDNTEGLILRWALYRGTDKTGTITQNQWGTFDSAIRYPDITSTWWTTNDATFEITGLQLEVSDHATEFEMRSYGDELARCQRYYQNIDVRLTTGSYSYKYMYEETFTLMTEMRTAPTLSASSAYGVNTGTFHTNTADDYTTMTDGCTLVDSSTTALAIRGGSNSTYHYMKGRVSLTSEL